MNRIQEKEKKSTIDSEDEQHFINVAENIIEQFNPEIEKSKKIKFFIILPILILCLLILTASTIFAIININSDAIINGITIHGIDVSGLTIDEATDKINTEINNQLSQGISLTHNDFSATLFPSQLNTSFDVNSAVNLAYSYGRSKNIFENNYTIINTLSSHVNIEPTITYDTNLLNNAIENINSILPDAVVQPNYYIDGTKLIIVNGKEGSTVNSESFINDIYSSLLNNTSSIDIPINNTKPNNINIDSIYADIHKSATDAYYTTNPYVVYPSSNGMNFDISIDDAKNMLNTYQEEYTIPLKILYPNVTTNQIGTEAFPDLLSDFSTSFASSNKNRSTNITIAASKINGTVVMPGESFSYNETVGRRTLSSGFTEAPAYSNGEVVQEVGGGVCQVSSTLYNAVLYSNLNVTERHNHGFKPTYVKPGLDATVSWGGPDFKFTNNRAYPIKIVCDTSGKNLHIYIYGLKADTDYKVTLEADYISTVYPSTVYKSDSSLASGVHKVIQSGSNGCETVSYKILYDNAGNFVDKILLSKDTYNAHNKIIAVGN